MAIEHLSYSSINTLLRCPRAWKFKYIDHKPSIFNCDLLVGRCYHSTLAYAYNRKMAGNAVTDEEIADIFNSFWDQEIADKLVYDERGEPRLEAAPLTGGAGLPGS